MSKKTIAHKKTPTKRATQKPAKRPNVAEAEAQDRPRLAAEYPTPWDGADRFAENADPMAVLRATFESCQVDAGNDVLAQAVERTLDELGVLELSLERSDSAVIEAGRFVERMRKGLAAALWLHQRGSVAS